MRFSTSLDFNSHPNWKDSYINYERLKKLIYAKEIEETRGHSLAMTGSDNRTSLGKAYLLSFALQYINFCPRHFYVGFGTMPYCMMAHSYWVPP